MSNGGNGDRNFRAIKCRCGVPVSLLRSWTQDNPGRRFLKGKFSNPEFSRGCGYFSWYDELQMEWQKNAINQLMLEKDVLKGELMMSKGKVSHLQERNKKLREANILLRQIKAYEDVNVDNEDTGRKSCRPLFSLVVVVCLLVLVS
ncbi:uncharacterized protein LOC141608151 [Silene latifolia]|uniref:uncharacterized protein LOC141608151 n=1 Tax=Silene latifolia TaxID=37657 RepID=UPI003D76F0EE